MILITSSYYLFNKRYKKTLKRYKINRLKLKKEKTSPIKISENLATFLANE